MLSFLSRGSSGAGLWLVPVLILCCLPAGAQELSFEEQQAMLAQQARQRAMEQIRDRGMPLEGVIDAGEYIVGPGDVFQISVGGSMPQQNLARVTADGVLVVPEGGSFTVAGRSLADARDIVIAGLRRIYRNVPLGVALAEPRQFYVHVSGNVEHPGRHAVVPIARVEDAVAAGMRNRSPLSVLRDTRWHVGEGSAIPALRSVEVRRRDGTLLRVDLLNYYASGDLGDNPYLRDGDAVFVPTLVRDASRMIFVEREGESSGSATDRLLEGYDFRDGDTVSKLIRIKGGDALLGRTDRVRLLRSDTKGDLVSFDVDVAAIRNGAASDVPLLPGDRVLIPRDRQNRGSAAVVGYVRFPGSYPIVDNQTTLRDLVNAAGGLREDGLLRGAFLERRGSAITQADREREGLTRALESIGDPVQRTAFLETASFEQARLSDLPFGSRQYMVREMMQFQRVSLALGDDPSAIPDVRLRDGDRLVVPRDPRAVLVIGQVRHPGYVAYRPDGDAAYYIGQAGGLGPAATDIYVQEAGTGYLRTPGNGPIRSGDAVFVDRKVIADTESLQALALQEQQLAFQRDQDRRAARMQIFQTGIAVVGTVATIVTTYLLMTRD